MQLDEDVLRHFLGRAVVSEKVQCDAEDHGLVPTDQVGEVGRCALPHLGGRSALVVLTARPHLPYSEQSA